MADLQSPGDGLHGKRDRDAGRGRLRDRDRDVARDLEARRLLPSPSGGERDRDRDRQRERDGGRDKARKDTSPPRAERDRDWPKNHDRGERERDRGKDRDREGNRDRDRDRGLLSGRSAEAVGGEGGAAGGGGGGGGGAQPCGVGMTLEPVDPGCDGYCYVYDIKEGGAVHQHGRVVTGDKLVRVDGVSCLGVLRDDIKRRVLGPPQTEIVLDFQRAGHEIFTVRWCTRVTNANTHIVKL
jgi:hypothetical protein